MNNDRNELRQPDSPEEQALAIALSENAALRRIRDRSARITLDMRQAFERAQSELAQLRRCIDELTQRYWLAYDDPVLSFGGKIRRRSRLVASGLRFGSLRRADLHGADVIRRSIYFDRVWYLEKYPDVAASGIDAAEHYARFGWREGREPSVLFSVDDYLLKNPDIEAADVNPLLHYIEHGRNEGRLGGVVLVTQGQSEINSIVALSDTVLFVSGEPESAGHVYRVSRYMEAARANGQTAQWLRADEVSRCVGGVDRLSLVVIWRATLTAALEKFIARVRQAGVRVVFDVDDLMVAPSLVDLKTIDGIRTQHLTVAGVKAHFELVHQCMLAADLCFATTEELACHMRGAGAGKVTHVLPNGFDRSTHDLSRQAAREWRSRRTDDLIRIGYAGGTRTHQRDFGVVVGALARVLSENKNCRLVLFKDANGSPRLDVEEFSALWKLSHQIEWRLIQPLRELPRELARFDINLAPLEFGNPYCEAKSELKFFEAALVDVPTIASPTGPYRRAIEHGRTGYLAASADDWYFNICRLVKSPDLRHEVGRAAYRAALGRFGPVQRAAAWGRATDQIFGGVRAATAFALGTHLSRQKTNAPQIFPSEIVFEQHGLDAAQVTVVVPLYNYEQYIVEALESVKDQTLSLLDLVVVDGASTDNSLEVAVDWARGNAARFNRVVVLRNYSNYGLGFCRNSAFDAADTSYVLPLDADNRLRPSCCETLLDCIREESVAYVYPTIQHFGASTSLIGAAPYSPQRFVAGNYVDAMALVAKEAWAVVGGYDHIRHGWEDYDFWCRIAEAGLGGHWKDEPLAEYRVHSNSMMTIQTVVPDNYRRLHRTFKSRHPWVSLVDEELFRDPPPISPLLTDESVRTRLDLLLQLLRAPDGQKLTKDTTGDWLVSVDGLSRWPVIQGCPVLVTGGATPEIRPLDPVSNPLPERALSFITQTKGWVLNLSAAGSAQRHENVVEVGYAISGNTDVVADAHALPFDDDTFEAALVINALEHCRQPDRVAAELRRVLKPGGSLLVLTAFMQPLHERPWHFFNCTRHGLEQWFSEFDIELIQVSPNFAAHHTLGWVASEAEAALRREVSQDAGDQFLKSPIGRLVDMWRNSRARDDRLWTNFDQLSQLSQEIIAASFEMVARNPPLFPDLSE